MASETYTAHEMRVLADRIWDYETMSKGLELCDNELEQVDCEATHDLIHMLRQAADMIESEERRKASTTTDYSFVDESGFRVSYLYDSVETAKRRAIELGYNAKYFIRREVGEWEEV